MAVAALMLLASACAPAVAPATPVPIRAVYLVMGQSVLPASDLQAHPEILVVHSFNELAAHTHSKVAIWIDKSATPLDHASWLSDAPQAYYPLVVVGYHDSLYSFKYMLSLCCFLGPIVDWRTIKLEPGFSVIQREDSGGSLPVYTFGRSYDQVPTAGDILAITDALLDGRLKSTPTPEVLPGASPTPPPAFAGFTVQVELDVFSGRPNPTWALSAPEIDAFQQKLGALSTAAEQPYPGRLGYRGLIVTLSDKSGGQLPVTWRVWDGVAQITTGTATAFYADPHQALESWLLHSGQPFLPADLFATVQADMFHNPRR